MPSRQENKRAKRRAKYLQVRDDVLESARASYKADPEKKQTAEPEIIYYLWLNANGIMQTWKRNGQLNAKAMKQTQQRNRPKRVRYGKAKRTLQNQRGHRKRTTDKVIQRYVNVDVVTCTVSQILSRVCI